MNRRTLWFKSNKFFRLWVLLVLICACHQKSELRLQQFVAKPVLNNEPTKPLYLADTDLRLTIPSGVAFTKKRSGTEWTTESIDYALKRGDRTFCEVRLSRWSRDEGHLVIRGAKQVLVGPWQGLWSETKKNGQFTGILFIDVPRKSWPRRMWSSACQRLRILRGNETWPNDTKGQLKKIKEGQAEGERAYKEAVAENLGFHSVNFFYSDLAASDRDLVLEIAASLKIEELTAFSSTVDWYKPPPDEFQLLQPDRKVPDGLIVAIAEPLRDEATVLLGNADFVELTKEQAVHYTSDDPDSLAGSLIKKKTDMLQSGRYMPEELNSQIATLREWEHQLKPYLIKAVALRETELFEGTFFSEDLLIYQGVMGHHPLPMMRMPVVAFLPEKPRHVYNAVGMIW